MIKIITTVYNAEKYIEKCINSVLSQDYNDWEMFIIDDGSTDNTSNIIKKYCSNKIISFFIEKNQRAALKYQFETINKFCKDEDIILLLDGDDWLASNNVFSYIVNIYNINTNLLLTYGQFHPSDNSYKSLCVPLHDVYVYRKSNIWVTSHLRTFKFKLFKNIKKEDLIDEDTKDFYQSASDVALMLPLLEMAGNDRYICIDKVLYIYNNENPINDMKVRELEQTKFANKIRNKMPYQRIIL